MRSNKGMHINRLANALRPLQELTSGSICVCLISLLLCSAGLQSQEYSDEMHASRLLQPPSLRVMFYNAENLFDTLDDPGYPDEEFTPSGGREWIFPRYRRKLINLSRVLMHCGGWRLPEVIGLCEIEKRGVLEDLLRYTPLRACGYQIIHFDSRDPRGIDVALLYLPEYLDPVFARPVSIAFQGQANRRTRDILHVEFRLSGGIPLHIFVNHWPSRFGGEQKTASFRMDAALCLRQATDSILRSAPEALVVAMGDFNDSPENESMQFMASDNGLINLMQPLIAAGSGTHKHAGHWAILDQMLVSPSLVSGGSWEVQDARAVIMAAPYLLEEEINQTGHRPYRSFAGTVFQGGFSDHLPVFIDLVCKDSVP